VQTVIASFGRPVWSNCLQKCVSIAIHSVLTKAIHWRFFRCKHCQHSKI